MTFICPCCYKKCCTGISCRDFIVIDDEKNLTGISAAYCGHCGTKLQIHVEAKVTELRVIPAEVSE